MSAVKFPDDAPEWLRTAVSDLEDEADRTMSGPDSSRAVGFFTAVSRLKDAITHQANTIEARRKKELRELTFPEKVVS